MANRFTPQRCPKCGARYDALLEHCPGCGQESSDRGLGVYSHHIKLGWIRQLAIFLVGWLGFQLLVNLIAAVWFAAVLATNPGWTTEDLSEYSKTVGFNGPLNFLSYGLLFAFIALLLWKNWKNVIQSFRGWKPFAIGALTGIGVIMASIACNVFSTALAQVIGIEYGDNQNQNLLAEIVPAFPVISLLIFGLIGPFCEECTYRVGLFSFLSRISRPAAYAISAVFFGLIHFGWNTITGGDADALILELLNLPAYIVSGLIFSISYDKGGFSASWIGHAFNNVYAISMMLIIK
ncbi:MAG: CPBP family intramembrane metalloprotease [Bacilli bacterium]|nr:CPBP family intramembrane metalloprotease [Bacilli bacterium]